MAEALLQAKPDGMSGGVLKLYEQAKLQESAQKITTTLDISEKNYAEVFKYHAGKNNFNLSTATTVVIDELYKKCEVVFANITPETSLMIPIGKATKAIAFK